MPGDAIDTRIGVKEIGDCNSLTGTFDGIPYDLFVLKDSSGYTT